MSKILFVIDMQNDFVHGVLGSEEAKKIVNPMKHYLSTFDGKIIFTQDTHHASDFETTLEGQNLPLHCDYQSDGWQIIEALTPFVKSSNQVEKPTFGCKDLPLQVTHNDDVYFCGVCTDICVISNALLLRTAYPNMHITCLSNLCAGSSLSAHQAALTVMKSCEIDIKEV